MVTILTQPDVPLIAVNECDRAAAIAAGRLALRALALKMAAVALRCAESEPDPERASELRKIAYEMKRTVTL